MISDTNCSATATSSPLAELFSSSWAIRIMLRPATTSGTTAIRIAKIRSLLRRLILVRTGRLPARRQRLAAARRSPPGRSAVWSAVSSPA